jgi:hypothetical protein
MKRISFLLVIMSAIVSFCSCKHESRSGSRAYNEQEIAFEASNSFNQVKFTGGYNIELIQGETESLTLMKKKESASDVKYWVEDSVLYVRNDTQGIRPEETHIKLKFKDLKQIHIEGGATLKSREPLQFDTLSIKLEGGANLRLQLNVNHLYTYAAGGVNMELTGTANRFEAITEGAGNIDADHLETKHVICRVSGVGNASVYATEVLDATVEGVGKIGYRGNPVINKKVDGLGLVYKK